MAVLASPDEIYSTFYDLRFHSFPPSFDAPLVLQPSTWLLSPLPLTDTTQTAYSIPSLLSPLFPPPSAFSSIFDVEMLFRLPSSQQLVSFHVLSSSNLVLLIMFMM